MINERTHVTEQVRTEQQLASNEHGWVSLVNGLDAYINLYGAKGGVAEFVSIADLEKALVGYQELLGWLKAQPFELENISVEMPPEAKERAWRVCSKVVEHESELLRNACKSCGRHK